MRYDRDAILAATDLAALADELLGERRGTRTPTWTCPVSTHAQSGRTPPLTVFTTRRSEQRWTCHGCGEAGTAIDLVMLTIGGDVRDALEWLAARSGAGRRSFDAPLAHRPTGRSRVGAAPVVARGPVAGLDDYVEACERHLWSPRGRAALRWLTGTRGLAPEVLRPNRVGFDPGARVLDRPDGVPRSPGVVLPVLDQNCRAIFTQTRRLNVDDDGPRYLNCASRAAPNPRVALYRPPAVTGSCVLVCEGAIDGLSAVAAGYRSAALLGVALADENIARRLAELEAPLAVAFDADSAGDTGARRLVELLRGVGAPASRLRPPASHGDLNAWMVSGTRGADWSSIFASTAKLCCREDHQVLTR